MTFDFLKDGLTAKLQDLIPPGERLNSFGTVKDYSHRLTDARKAAVMLFVYHDGREYKVIFIQRPDYEGVHGGQIALPGGKLEADESFLDAAIRESQEEIGVSQKDFEVVGSMHPIYIPPSKFYVQPYIAVMKQLPLLVAEEKEVDEILHVPIEVFKDYSRVKDVRVNARGMQFQMPAFVWNEKVIWGATARIMAEFVHYNPLKDDSLT